MIYLVSGSLFLIECILFYAMLKFNVHERKLKSVNDFIALFIIFITIFVCDYTLFFFTKISIYCSAVFGMVCSMLLYFESTDEELKKDGWWVLPGSLVLFTLFAPIVMPLLFFAAYFDLGGKKMKKK
jgi:xanthine/uracil permease